MLRSLYWKCGSLFLFVDFTVVLIILFIYVLYLINIIGNRKVYGNIRKYLKMIYGNNKVVKTVYKWNMDK